MKFKAFIFDLFGTIVDGFAASASGYQEEFAAALDMQHDQLSHHWRELTGRRTLGEFQTVEASIEHVCRNIGVIVTAEQIAKATEIRLRLTRHALTPKADALSTFARLKAEGLKLGLLSNCSIEIPIVWPETEFAKWFDSTVFSSRERIKKPAPEVYRLACERLAVAPEECFYVADGENYELAAAARLGMRPILIKTSEAQNDVRREAQQWQGTTVSSLHEILALVKK
jgi:putative hydrolase of the HAD superfamily